MYVVFAFADAGCSGNLYVSMKSWQGGGSASEIPALLSLNSNTLSPPIPTHVISSMGSASSSSSSSSGRSRRSTGGRRPNKENGVGCCLVISCYKIPARWMVGLPKSLKKRSKII